MTKVTAIYLRVSTDKQDERPQEDYARQYCALHAMKDSCFKNIKIYVDHGVSGGKPFAKRPESKQLLKDIKERKVAHLIAVKLDRIGRDTIDVLNTINFCHKHKTVVHLLDIGGGTSTEGAVGRLITTLIGACAEFERQRLRERVNDKMSFKRAHKTVYGSWGELCGTLPYGFELAPTIRKNEKTGRYISEIIPHHTEFERLKWIVTQRFTTKASYQQIAKLCNNTGWPTKTGIPWTRGSIRNVLETKYTDKIRTLIEEEQQTLACA